MSTIIPSAAPPAVRRGIVAVQANAEVSVSAAIRSLTGAFSDFKADYNARLAALDHRFDELETMGGRPGLGGAAGRTDEADHAKALAAVTGRPEAADLATYRTYTEGFAAYLRRGENALAPDVRAAMHIGSDPDGGYVVPGQMVGTLARRIYETSPIRQIATVIPLLTGDHIEGLSDHDDAVTGGWVGETDSRNVTATPQLGEQSIYLREQYAQPKVTQRLLDLAGFNVEGWLNGKIADKFARDEAAAFVNGDGIAKPRGFLSYKADATTDDDDTRAWGVLQYVPTGAAGAFPAASGIPGASDPDCLITLVSKLKPAYRAGAVWLMNRATAAVVRKMKDADGRYLWRDSLIEGQPDMLLGYRVVLAEDMPSLDSDTFPIAFGNFAVGYVIVDRPAVTILRDPYTEKPWVKLYARRYVGGDLVNSEAIKLLKAAAS